jgi:hypothetical protein
VETTFYCLNITAAQLAFSFFFCLSDPAGVPGVCDRGLVKLHFYTAIIVR